MDNSYFKKMFLEKLAERLKDDEFKYIKSKEAFTRKVNFGEQLYTIHFHNWVGNDCFYITQGVHVRFEEVESFYHESSWFEKKYHKYSTTVGCSLDNYLNDAKEVFQQCIKNEKDAFEASEYCFSLYKEIAIPFFNSYNTLESLHHLANSNPNEDSSILSFRNKGIKGLIVAYLIRVSDEELNKLIHIYSKQYAKLYDGFYKSDFDNVVENVKKHKREKEGSLL